MRAIREVAQQRLGDGQRQPRLPRPAGAGERDQPGGAAQERGELLDLRLAADERRRRSRQVAPRAAGRIGERRVLTQDRRLQRAQRLARLQPELLDQQRAPAAVDLQRLGLATGAVEREHQLTARAFAQRLRGDELLQVGQRLGVTAASQPPLRELLARAVAQLVQARDLGPQRSLVAEVGEHRSPPQRQRRDQLRLDGLAGEQRLELLRVPRRRDGIARAWSAA